MQKTLPFTKHFIIIFYVIFSIDTISMYKVLGNICIDIKDRLQDSPL